MNTLALCIPAYNAATHLPRLLESAGKQTIPFDEILVYDDCSLDDTAKIAAKFGAKVISGDVNRGCSYGKNIMAEKTFCKWVHFHDADDDLLPGFTQQVHQWIKVAGDKFEVLLLNFEYIDFSTGEFLGGANHDINALRSDPLKYAIENKIVNFGIYLRDTFIKAGGFDLDKEVLYNEDNAFHQRLAKAGYRFDYLAEVTCINYRYAESMSMSNVLKCARANFHVLEKTATTHGNQYPLELSRQIWNCIASLAACKDWLYVKKAIALSKVLGYNFSPNGNTGFKILTRIQPLLAVWLRENMIRVFKPHLRNA